ncbi:MAG: amino acid ABC transporter substrate-binding protein [Egibacteraceae bacterium]
MRRRLAVACVVLALIAAGCGTGRTPPSPGGGAEAGVLEIGAALSLTGALAREGRLTRQGYELCQDVINAQGGVRVGDRTARLDITYQDDKSQPDTAAQLVDGFNDQGVTLVLGPYGSASTEASSAVVERNGQVMVASAGADDKIFAKGYQRTFAVLSPASHYVAAIVRAVAEQANPKPRTVAFLTADDGFSKTATEGGTAEAARQGMRVVAVESFPAHTTDVSAALTRIRPLSPDLILGSVHLQEGIAIIKQSAELGVKPAGGFGETVAPPTPDFIQALGAQAEGVLGSSQWVPQSAGQDRYFGTAADYARAFEATFGEAPEYHAAEASAACLALALAVEQAGSADPDAVRTALASLDTSSFFGPLAFDETGKNVTKPMAVVQIQDGKAVTVWPKEAAQAPLRWPAAPR